MVTNRTNLVTLTESEKRETSRYVSDLAIQVVDAQSDAKVRVETATKDRIKAESDAQARVETATKDRVDAETKLFALKRDLHRLEMLKIHPEREYEIVCEDFFENWPDEIIMKFPDNALKKLSVYGLSYTSSGFKRFLSINFGNDPSRFRHCNDIEYVSRTRLKNKNLDRDGIFDQLEKFPRFFFPSGGNVPKYTTNPFHCKRLRSALR